MTPHNVGIVSKSMSGGSASKAIGTDRTDDCSANSGNVVAGIRGTGGSVGRVFRVRSPGNATDASSNACCPTSSANLFDCGLFTSPPARRFDRNPGPVLLCRNMEQNCLCDIAGAKTKQFCRGQRLSLFEQPQHPVRSRASTPRFWEGPVVGFAEPQTALNTRPKRTYLIDIVHAFTDWTDLAERRLLCAW